MTFEEMWAELAPIGRVASGGYVRLPFGAAEREAHAWFVEQCGRRGLTVETDGFANTVAWWGPEDRKDAVLTGSHLDSVVDGGGYDGALGVVSGLAAVDLLRERGFRPARPLGVCVFVAEEGSRFPLPCLGSRLATGTSQWAEVAGLRDADGVALADVLEPENKGPAEWWSGASAFVELHVEQGRGLVEQDAAVGVANGVWPHGRYRFDFSGEANHAGTTRMQDRRDPMLSYAMTVLAANKQARLAGQRATFGRVEAHPNATNAIPSRVTAWLDARATSTEELLELVADVERLAVDRAGRDGTDVVVTPESVSRAVPFDRELTALLPGATRWPVLGSAAGHDAGVMAMAGLRTTMLLVRNRTGVSHSPAESADTADCLAGVEALAETLAALAGSAG